MNTITYEETLVIRQCWCGINFGVPTNLNRRYIDREQEALHCPLGHSMIPGTNQVKKLKAQLANQRERTEHYRDEMNRIELRRRAAQGQVTKIKNRVKNGVCPCCNRTFANLGKHMKSKHPNFATQLPNKEK